MKSIPPSGTEELYLRGRYFWNLRTTDGLQKAIDFYTQAIVKDPEFAEAYAGLAEAYDLLPQFGRADFGDSLTRAVAAANRALTLDPNLAAAHRAKGFALFFWDWDVRGSDAEFKRALALDPNSAESHHWYASTLHSRLDGRDAIRQIDEAERLNPTSAAIAADTARIHAEYGDFNAGMRALKDIERTQPTLASPAMFLRDIYFARQDYPAYIAEARRYASVTQNSGDLEMADAVARGWAHGGKYGLLKARVRVLTKEFDRGADRGFNVGETWLLLGRPEKALPYFRSALMEHELGLAVAMSGCGWAEALGARSGYASLFASVRQRLSGWTDSSHHCLLDVIDLTPTAAAPQQLHTGGRTAQDSSRLPSN